MGKQQRRFTKEFEEEAIRLVETSGQTQRSGGLFSCAGRPKGLIHHSDRGSQ
jgi:hypothetical protein